MGITIFSNSLKKGNEEMKNSIMRILSVVLMLCASVVPLFSISVLAATEEIVPYYNNVGSATTNLQITESGKLTINYKYVGSSQVTTKAVLTTYIEKKVLGLFWTRVDIGTTNDQWVDTIYDYRYTGTRTFQLPSSGEYRITVIFVIYGNGGEADNIVAQKTVSY